MAPTGNGPARNGPPDHSRARTSSAASRTQASGPLTLRGVRTVLLMVGVFMLVGSLHFARDFLVPLAVARKAEDFIAAGTNAG